MIVECKKAILGLGMVESHHLSLHFVNTYDLTKLRIKDHSVFVWNCRDSIIESKSPFRHAAVHHCEHCQFLTQ